MTHADASKQSEPQRPNTPEENIEEKIGRNDKIKLISQNGDEIQVKFKKLDSYLAKGYTRA